MNRRTFLGSMAGLAAGAHIGAHVSAQSQAQDLWGGPVLDIHLHLRPTADGNLAHIDGCGVAKAVLLCNVNALEHAKQVAASAPGRFVRFASTDAAQADAVDKLREARRTESIGFGELKSQVRAAGPEMQRIYALAAELGVPVTLHFQEINQPGSPGTYNTGLKTFDVMLKAFPKTTFIGHADAFWANVSADYAEDTAYPTGRIAPGGVTDRFLADYPNLFADMSANSCNNFLKRDPEFAAAFLVRHQHKLMFGSDCPCPDGSGKVRCIARETLTLLKALAPPDVFRRITWENGTRLLRI